MCYTVHSELFSWRIPAPNSVCWWHLALEEWAGYRGLWVLFLWRVEHGLSEIHGPSCQEKRTNLLLRVLLPPLWELSGHKRCLRWCPQNRMGKEWVQEGTTWDSLQNKAIKKFSKCPVYILWLLEGMVQIVLVFCIPSVRPVNWALAMWQKLL